MAAYIAFIATLNLCIGYALGVYIGVMPGITPRRDPESDEEPIGLATDLLESAETPEPPPVEEPVAAAPEPEPEPEPEPVPEPEPPAAGAKPEFNNILEGLADFRAKLDAVSEKLCTVTDDREAIDECADDLKQANDAYLEKANEALDSLAAEDQSTANAANRKLRQTLTKQSAEVEQTNKDIEEIVAEKNVETVREKLMDSTEQLSASAVATQVAAEDAKAAAEVNVRPVDEIEPDEEESPAPVEAIESLEQIDALLERIQEHLSSESPDTPLQVAAIALSADGETSGEHVKRLLGGLEKIVEQELAPGQTMAVDEAGRLVLVLPGDDKDEATGRCERIRQQVQATTFRRNGASLQALAMCGVADTASAPDGDEVLRRLTESLAEAYKTGESQTYHHDGNTVELVESAELEVAPMNLEI